MLVASGQLEALRSEILRVRSDRVSAVDLVAMDLGEIASFEKAASALFVSSIRENTHYSRVSFVNNAGSLILGFTGRHSPSAVELDNYVRLNMTSPNFLSESCVKYLHEKTLKSNELRIVNVSSLVAIQNFPSWGQYASVKAGREMFHKNIALEWTHDIRLKVMNYAPGPLDTNVSFALNFPKVLCF